MISSTVSSIVSNVETILYNLEHVSIITPRFFGSEERVLSSASNLRTFAYPSPVSFN